MKYLSLDLETTCLTPATENILQCSMVVEDTTKKTSCMNLPHMTFFINADKITGSAYALAMNAWILDIVSGRKENTTGYEIYDSWPEREVRDFLDKHFGDSKKITVAGKNVAGFDIPFLPTSVRRRFKYKVIDPGCMMINWNTDTEVPDLKKCKELAGLSKEVAHDAREDALDVIRVLRTLYK